MKTELDAGPLPQQQPAARVYTPWRGAFWKLSACACFAGINASVRYLSGGGTGEAGLSTYELAFFQNVFGLMFMLPWLWNDRRLLKVHHLKLHMLRAVLSVIGIILWYTALKYMEIAQAVALNFTGPMFTILWARLFLGEMIPRNRWLAILLGFLGAFIAGRPDLAMHAWQGSASPLVALIPLLSAAAISGSYILCKRLVVNDGPKTLALYLLLLMTPLSLIPCVATWQTPTAIQWPLLATMGLLTAGAHYALNKALVYAEVTFLIPFGLSRLLFSASLGYLLFAEIPAARTWVGASLIVTALLCVDYVPKRRAQRRAAAIGGS